MIEVKAVNLKACYKRLASYMRIIKTQSIITRHSIYQHVGIAKACNYLPQRGLNVCLLALGANVLLNEMRGRSSQLMCAKEAGLRHVWIVMAAGRSHEDWLMFSWQQTSCMNVAWGVLLRKNVLLLIGLRKKLILLRAFGLKPVLANNQPIWRFCITPTQILWCHIKSTLNMLTY